MFKLAVVLSIMALGLSLLAFGVIATTFAVMAKIALFIVGAAILLCIVRGLIERDKLFLS